MIVAPSGVPEFARYFLISRESQAVKLPKAPLREVITIDGTNVKLEVKGNPVENLGVLEAKDLFRYLRPHLTS